MIWIIAGVYILGLVTGVILTCVISVKDVSNRRRKRKCTNEI